MKLTKQKHRNPKCPKCGSTNTTQSIDGWWFCCECYEEFELED